MQSIAQTVCRHSPAEEDDQAKRKSLVQRSGELLNELLTDEGDITGTDHRRCFPKRSKLLCDETISQ